MSNTVEVAVIPTCDFCALDAKYDSQTHLGPWAYLCQEHWHAYGVQKLGTGFGQKLVLKK